MPLIVGVHGIGHQTGGPNVLKEKTWLPALRDGLQFADGPLLSAQDLECAFYGIIFRPPGGTLALEYQYDASDIKDPWEYEFLELLWQEAGKIDPSVTGPEERAMGLLAKRTPAWVQAGLHELCKARFFRSLAEKALIGNLKQVKAYLHDKSIREEVMATVAQVVKDDTRILVGHSLGSVVGYECLCAHPEWRVNTLVTLGSPLGIPNLVFDQLNPSPQNGRGVWPGSVRWWVNISDRGDLVALVKDLRPLFGDNVENIQVNNSATAHNVVPYLTAKETGDAIKRGLAHS
jgi:hypothetical protein